MICGLLLCGEVPDVHLVVGISEQDVAVSLVVVVGA